MAIQHEAINLDCESLNPDDVDAYAQACDWLADYGHAKARAMRARLSGDISAAMRHEAQCEYIFNRLPEWARW